MVDLRLGTSEANAGTNPCRCGTRHLETRGWGQAQSKHRMDGDAVKPL
jgi:hypothetical protein